MVFWDFGIWWKILIYIRPEQSDPEQNTAISAVPSVYSLIRLDRNSYSQLPEPFSNCVVLEDNTLIASTTLANRTIFDLTVQTGYAYTHQFCLAVCLQVWTTKICHCNSMVIFYTLSNSSFCHGDDFQCAYNVPLNATFIADCKSLCPLECSRSIIESDQAVVELDKNYLLSSESVRNFDFARDMPNGTDLNQFMHDNVAVVNIEYYSPEYTAISESPKMDWQDLIGELSGHLHLFVGMSLLSFVEIVELFAFISLRCIK